MNVTRVFRLGALAGVFSLASAWYAPGRARAQSNDEPFTVAPRGCLIVDGGVLVAMPAALPTGLSTGVGGGVMFGGPLAAGARVSWASATEYTTAWTVTHSDLRLRAAGAIQHAAGRGVLALRLAVGGTLVHETRTRDQGNRAGLTGDDLQTSAWQLVPAADLEATVSLRLVGAWDVIVSAGPSVDYFDGDTHVGWLGALGVAWQP